VGVLAVFNTAGRGALVKLGGLAIASALVRGCIVILLSDVAQPETPDNFPIVAFLFLNAIIFDAFSQKLFLKGIMNAAEAEIERQRHLVAKGADGNGWEDFFNWSARQRLLAALVGPAAGAFVVSAVVVVYVAVLSATSAVIAAIVMLAGSAAVAFLRRRTFSLLQGAEECDRRTAPTLEALAVSGGTGYVGGLLGRVLDAEAGLAAEMRGWVASRLSEEQTLLGTLGLVAVAVISVAPPMVEPLSSAETARAAIAGILLMGPLSMLMGLSTPMALVTRFDRGATPSLPRLAMAPDRVAGIAELQLRGIGDGTTLSLRRGKLVSIVGANGSGKSRLLERLAGGAPPPDEIAADGIPVAMNDRQAWLAGWCVLVPQAPHFPNLAIPEEDRERFAEALALAGLCSDVLGDGGKVAADTLSSTGSRRLALALALMDQRPIILLDDFLAGQDAPFRRRMLDEVFPAICRNGRGLVVTVAEGDGIVAPDLSFRLSDGALIEGKWE
jgi:energy-coupling factor transporter ATP-binding protein EcfA2